jgi:hypothetical protein
MEVILQGSFDHFRPNELLTILSSFRHSGVLDITSDDRKARVFFDEGALVHAASNTTAEPMAALADLLVWSSGIFAFSSPAALPEGVDRSVVDVDAAVRHGHELLALYPNERILLYVIDDPAPSEIKLTRDEFRIVVKIGSGRSLRQLRADVERSAADLYPLLHRLETGGIIERKIPPEDVVTVRNLDVSDATVARFISDAPTFVPPPAEQTAESFVDSLATHAAVASEDPIGRLTLPNGDVLTLVDDVYMIGRDADSQVPINDSSVSSRHARIVRNEGGYVIEDAESRNGTYVNGERINGSQRLTDADVVRLGKIVLTFNGSVPVASADQTGPHEQPQNSV